METRCDEATNRYDNPKNLILISLEFGSSGLGIRLSKSSWDPYPFVSYVDEESTAQERGLQVGDCILKVENVKRFSQRTFPSQAHKNSETKTKIQQKTFKVNGVDCLGQRIQDIAKQIHNPTDDNSNKVNLLLWRSTNAQVKFIST